MTAVRERHVPLPAPPAGRPAAGPDSGPLADAERYVALRSWLAFGALAIYATLRWATMLMSPEHGRVYLCLAVVLVLAAFLRWRVSELRQRQSPSRRRQLITVLAVVVAALALIGIAGFPLHLLLGLHVAQFASALSHGISGLPGLLVPYIGGDPLVAAALVLGGAALLFTASLVFGTATPSPSLGRLALAALPLLVLAVVPSAIVAPHDVALHGLLAFVLVALLIFAPRLSVGRLAGVALVVGIAAALSTLGAGVIAGAHPWTDIATGQAASGVGTGSGVAERFNWQQTYGVHGWPFTGATVLTIRAPTATLWKAEDLDDFTGAAWTQTPQPHMDDGDLDGVSGRAIARWTETLRVKVGSLDSPDVIAAGYANAPDVPGAQPGVDPGTWVTNEPLQPGETYSAMAYVPHPSTAQLERAGTAYPQAVQPFRSLTRLPTAPYAGVEALAQRLGAGVRTPYAYVQAVLAYLQHGFVYTLNPPAGGRYPLADFLLSSRRGYCQQFAGAMALLLRMKGVPARVAVGFSTGARLQNSDTYLVGDEDAHAWVEVWFPRLGWITFDPTPGQAGTGAGTTTTGASSMTPTGAATSSTSPPLTATRAARATTVPQILRQTVHQTGTRTGADAATSSGASSGSGWLLIAIALAVIAVLVLGLGAGFVLAYLRRPSAAELAAEIELAFARCGRPLGAELTLTALAAELSDSPAAAAYVRSLADARYGPQGARPTSDGRAALRGWLAHGSGPIGRLRALWALPPRRPVAGQ